MVKDVSCSFVVQYLCTFIAVFLLTWYLYYLYCFNYWNKKGVPIIAPSFPAGNILKPILGRENLAITLQNYYNEFKRQGHIHGGLYFLNGPVYFPIHPELVKHILTTDSEYFIDRGAFSDEKSFPLSGNLFCMRGSHWKNMRNKLSPTFTSGKLKNMYEIFLKKTENFIDTIEPTAQKRGEVNIKHVSTNFTADLLFATAFGLEGDSLNNPEAKLSKTALTLLDPPIWLFFKTVVINGLQNPGNLTRVVDSNKRLEYFLTDIVKNTIKYREENKIIRNDFLSLLLEVRDKEGLTFNEIVAQCYVFFLAGFETSSATISCCIHELAHNQELQNKLREKIFESLGTDFRKYSYEDILKLPYLDKVFNETLRLYPAAGFFNRICVKPYQVPGTDVVIEAGTPVLIPTLGPQRDPEYFPEPLKFDPERFNENQSLVPFTYLPFGDGPRICIGMRYGKLQTKLGIAALISKFKFLPSSKTPKYIESDKLSKHLGLMPAKGIMVKVEKL